MNILKKYWWLLLTFIIITLIFFFGYNEVFEPLKWKTEDNLAILGTVFAKLLIVGALLDQFISVFFPQDDDEAAIRAKSLEALNIAKENKKMLKNEILSQRLYGANNDDQMGIFNKIETQISTFDQTEKSARENIASIDTQRSSYVRKVAFACGLIIAVTGITIMDDFILWGKEGLNRQVFSFIDVVLTAAVLSGGTSGINQLLKVIKDSLAKN